MLLNKLISGCSLAVIISLLFSCSAGENGKSTDVYFKDYDLFLRKGIGPLNNDSVKQLRRLHLTFFQLISKDNNIDSVIIFNPYENKIPMKLSVLTNDSVQVFSTTYPYHADKNMMLKTYFRFTRNSAVQYVFYERDEVCHRTTIVKDQGVGMTFIYDPQDTVDFQRKLFGKEGLRIASTINSKVLKKGLSSNFTFLHWLSYKK